ncbi:hypothetical protein HDE_01920 [Halotydeus destructor]|nr:hypothetical protein HDE_01920 [Halotydeus destructor]
MSSRVISVAFIGICAVGFGYQVTSLTAKYLQYETMTRISMDIESYTYAADLHVCPSANQVFNLTAYNENSLKNGVESNLTEIDDLKDIYQFQSMMTISDLLQYSPPAGDFLFGCMVRRPGSNDFDSYDKMECHNMFQVTKYFSMQFICYQVHLIPLQNETKYDLGGMSYAISYPGTFYRLTLTNTWHSLLNSFKAMTVERAEGDKSSTLSPVISRGLSQGSAKYNMFIVSHFKMKYFRLPPPYQSHCRNYRKQGLRNAAYCSNKCLSERSLRLLDRVWTGSRAVYPVDKLPLSTNDLKNETVGKIFQCIYDDCKRACSQPECNLTWALTTIDRQSFKMDHHIVFDVVTSRKPSFIIEHDVQLTMESYLIFLMSCVGSWFGLSVLSFCPARVISRRRRQESNLAPDGATIMRGDIFNTIKRDMNVLLDRVGKLITQMNALETFLPLVETIEPIGQVAPPQFQR